MDSLARSALELPLEWRLGQLAEHTDAMTAARAVDVTVFTRADRDGGSLHIRANCGVNRTGTMRKLDLTLDQLAAAAAGRRPLCGCVTAYQRLRWTTLGIGLRFGYETCPLAIALPELITYDRSVPDGGHALPEVVALDELAARLRATMTDRRWAELTAAFRWTVLLDDPLRFDDDALRLPSAEIEVIHAAALGLSRAETARLTGDADTAERVFWRLAGSGTVAGVDLPPYEEEGPAWFELRHPEDDLYLDGRARQRTLLLAVLADDRVTYPGGLIARLPAGISRRAGGPEFVGAGEVPRATIEVAAAIFEPAVHDWFGSAILDAERLEQL